MSHPIASPAGFDAAGALGDWLEPAVVLPIVAVAAVYLAGWRALSRRMPGRFGAGRPVAFLAGLMAVTVAVSPQIGALAHVWLFAHMIQHLLLMLVAPPLIWLGAPAAPLLQGLPRPARRLAATALATRPVRSIARLLGDPRVAWIILAAALWVWHVPAAFDLALSSEAWHRVEHACFLGAALVFWHPVLAPWPARASGSRWSMIAYLLLAETQNALLSAILTFSDRVLYRTYALRAIPAGPGALSPLEDQALAGAIMWVPGAVIFAVPLVWLVVTSLDGPASVAPERVAATRD